MRRLSFTARTIGLFAAALTLSACGGESVSNEAGDAAANMTFEQIGNDASALEAAGNAELAPPVEAGNGAQPAPAGSSSAAPAPPPPAPGESEEAPVLGETKGGDTGGNTVGEVSRP